MQRTCGREIFVTDRWNIDLWGANNDLCARIIDAPEKRRRDAVSSSHVAQDGQRVADRLPTRPPKGALKSFSRLAFDVEAHNQDLADLPCRVHVNLKHLAIRGAHCGCRRNALGNT